MPINGNLSHYSDLAFGSAFAVYLLAFILLTAEFASHRVNAVNAAQAHRVLVGAGAPLAPTPQAPGRILAQPRRSRSERLGRMGVALIIPGWGLHLTSIVLRGLATDRAPWGNMYEFVALACAAGVGAGLFVLRKPLLRPMWPFVLLPVLILMFIAGTLLYATAAPVVPALQSYWLLIHVSIVSTGTGVFLISGVASLLFLLRIRYPQGTARRGTLAQLAQRLPDAHTLDRLAYRTVVFAFPLFGAGVVLGAIWAEAAWGRYWGWDPKETTAFVAWIIYAAYLHARATAGWRDSKAAWINVAGFTAMLFNLFVINIVVSGLHSYAGLN